MADYIGVGRGRGMLAQHPEEPALDIWKLGSFYQVFGLRPAFKLCERCMEDAS